MALAMTILISLLILVLFYLLVMFVLSQLVLSDLGRKSKITDDVPAEILKDVAKIVKKFKSREALLRNVARYQLENFYSEMNQVWKRFPLLFEKSVAILWKKKGFLHCHQQVCMLRRLLLATGKFDDEDIRYVITYCYLNIHEYTLINIGGPYEKNWVVVDPYAMSIGFRLGETLPHLAYVAIKKRGLSVKGGVGYKHTRQSIKNNK